MKTVTSLSIIIFLILSRIGIAQSHEVRPGYLQLKQIDEKAYDMIWKVPAKGDRRLGLYVRLPENCQSTEITSRFTDGAYVERLQVTCEGGLKGGAILIEGLETTRTDVLARIDSSNGHTQTVRLTPSQPEFRVLDAPGYLSVVRTYLKLGVKHILLGFDHLLFVLALLLLVEGWRRLVETITAFTVAHSLTLASATFSWVEMPQAPVEAIIALSIMFVAVEILHRHRGRTSIATGKPWLVAFVFGLLHGLGFAGALREIGLPDHAIPLALAFFNLGVEVGQLLFVTTIFLLLWLIGQFMPRRAVDIDRTFPISTTLIPPSSYAIGILASFWFIERTYSFFV